MAANHCALPLVQSRDALLAKQAAFFQSDRSNIVAVTHADVETTHRHSCCGTNRHRDRAQSHLQLLRDERVALAAHLQNFRSQRPRLVDRVRGDRAKRIFAQPGGEFAVRFVRQQRRPSEAGKCRGGRQRQRDTHQATDRDASDINDLAAIEHRHRARFADPLRQLSIASCANSVRSSEER